MEKKNISREECRQIQIGILQYIHDICEKHGLQYYMSGGTLLGAIRHKGFIPWDDDIDVMLFREDYDKLVQLVKEDSHNYWMTIVDHNNDGYFYPFAKIVDDRTVAKMEDNVTDHGIWVDLFPLDSIPDDDKLRAKFLKKCQFLRSIVVSMTTDFSPLPLFDKKTIVKRFLWLIAKIIGHKNVFYYTKKYISKYNGIDSKYVSCTYSPYVTHEYMLRTEVAPAVLLDFEDKKFYSTKAWDHYLKNLYGDYMKMPPVEKQKNHSIIAWWKE